MREFTEANEGILDDTTDLLETLCRPEKVELVANISYAIGRELITTATQIGLNTNEILAICHCLSNAMEVTVDEYIRGNGN